MIDLNALKNSFKALAPLWLGYLGLLWNVGMIKSWKSFVIDSAFLLGGWFLGAYPHCRKRRTTQHGDS